VRFSSAAESYDRFMGRYTTTLAPVLADAAGVTGGMKVLDVGSGPGGLTRELAARVGGENVAAIDPAAQFANACRERNPGVDARQGVAEALPWEDASFDAPLACLVIGFMEDADQGVREMARVTRAGGSVAACMWDIAGGGMTMLRTFWSAARELDPDVAGERARPGVSEGDIAQGFAKAGLQDVVLGRSRRKPTTLTSTTSGSRSPSASVPRANTWPLCPRSAGWPSEKCAGRPSPPALSRSPPALGMRAAPWPPE
jgi:SAM-dependent methyltransferase